jgi:flagellar biogenesis protein FliO
VAALIGGGVAVRLASRFLPALRVDPRHRAIQVLDRSPLGPKETVFLLRCGSRVLVVGSTPSSMTTLAEITDPQEAEQLERHRDARSSPCLTRHSSAPDQQLSDLKGKLDGMLQAVDRWKNCA